MDRNHKLAGRVKAPNWTEEEVAILVTMYNENMSYDDIGHRLNKTWGAVKNAVAKRRRKGFTDLPYRNKDKVIRTYEEEFGLKTSLFDRAWQGAVPFGHWSITKPWRRHA